VDRNPVRAGLAASAGEYRWSSGAPHLAGDDPGGLLDLEWWRSEGMGSTWDEWLGSAEQDGELEKCTYAGRPFGDADFVARVGERFGGCWTPGRRKKKPVAPEGAGKVVAAQTKLFRD
jgi:putative transposase